MSTNIEVLECPDGVSKKMWRSYQDTFRNGIDLWTSEDGMKMGYAICPKDGAAEALKFHWSINDFDASKLRPGFMYFGYPDFEFFDDPSSGRRRRKMIWMESSEPTQFPVLFYDLYHDLPTQPPTPPSHEQ